MNKGQVSLEYLMTYGIVIAIVVLAVVALYSMGVFDNSEYEEDFDSGEWECVEFRGSSLSDFEEECEILRSKGNDISCKAEIRYNALIIDRWNYSAPQDYLYITLKEDYFEYYVSIEGYGTGEFMRLNVSREYQQMVLDRLFSIEEMSQYRLITYEVDDCTKWIWVKNE